MGYNEPMDIFSKIKNLDLNPHNVVAVGGTALECYGIRKAADIDLLVTSDIYERLKSQGWEEVTKLDGAKILHKDDFEVGTNFVFRDYQPSMQKLFETAKMINGVLVIDLVELAKYKQAMGREKDLNDIKLINEFLNQNS